MLDISELLALLFWLLFGRSAESAYALAPGRHRNPVDNSFNADSRRHVVCRRC